MLYEYVDSCGHCFNCSASSTEVEGWACLRCQMPAYVVNAVTWRLASLSSSWQYALDKSSLLNTVEPVGSELKSSFLVTQGLSVGTSVPHLSALSWRKGWSCPLVLGLHPRWLGWCRQELLSVCSAGLKYALTCIPVSALLMLLRASSSRCVHSHETSFFVNLQRGSVRDAKSGMKCAAYCVIPRKDRISLILFRASQLTVESVFFWSALISFSTEHVSGKG